MPSGLEGRPEASIARTRSETECPKSSGNGERDELANEDEDSGYERNDGETNTITMQVAVATTVEITVEMLMQMQPHLQTKVGVKEYKGRGVNRKYVLKG